MNDLPICDKCGREIVGETGLAVETIDTGKEGFFCKGCVKEALTRLSMKDNKSVDEIQLLRQIRKFLKEKVN